MRSLTSDRIFVETLNVETKDKPRKISQPVRSAAAAAENAIQGISALQKMHSATNANAQVTTAQCAARKPSHWWSGKITRIQHSWILCPTTIRISQPVRSAAAAAENAIQGISALQKMHSATNANAQVTTAQCAARKPSHWWSGKITRIQHSWILCPTTIRISKLVLWIII